MFLACAECGSSGLNRPAEPRNEIEDTLVLAVPDFARWTPPVEERGAVAHAGMGQVADAEGGFQGEGDRIEPGDAVTQVLTEQGRQSSVQNEIGTTWDCDRASEADSHPHRGEAGAETAANRIDRSDQTDPSDRTDQSRRLSKRAIKHRRKEMTRSELNRRHGGTQPDLDGVALAEMLDSVKWLLPNSVKVISKFRRRAPLDRDRSYLIN